MMDGWMDGWMDGLTDGWTNERMDGCGCGCGWMEVGGLMDGWMDGFSVPKQYQKSKPNLLTLKAPITTAADDIHKYFFFVFRRK